MSAEALGRTFVVFNPASGRGRGARRMPAYRELLARYLPGHEDAVTSRPGEEAELAGRAVESGYDTVVAVGGDGTWSHVADRLVRMDAGVRLGVLPSGTGNDFGRSLGLSYADPERAVRGLVSGGIRKVDVGRLLTPTRRAERPDAAARADRHFLNVVGFGFDIAVIDGARRARFLKGEPLYKVTALRQLFRFPGLEVAIDDGAGFRREGRHLMVTVSNGRFFGGGFPIAPGATVDDGLLHACVIRDGGPLVRASLFQRAGKGRHVASPSVDLRPGAFFRLTFPLPPRLEVDGDVFVTDATTVEVEVRPGALEVAGGRPATP